MKYSYKFPAVKGIQANSEYYIAMVPCKLLSKLFITDPNDVMPEHRAQRKINLSRIPNLKKYILNRRNSYVFSALAASIDGDFEFKASEVPDVGILEIDMSATFLINDGQHRKTAIQEAIIEDETLGDETISIVFYKDKGLKRSQQMFTDLNKHAVNTSKSLNALYDSEDSIAILTRKTVDSIDFLKTYTDKENDNLGKYSKMLFTLSNLYNSNIKLVGSNKVTSELEKFVLNYWNIIVNNVTEWRELESKEITKRSLREDYIVTLGIVLLAFGKLGNYIFNNKVKNYEKHLKQISKINWLRSNPIWENRTIVNGKILRKEENINLTYIKIKELIGLEISSSEEALNNKINRG